MDLESDAEDEDALVDYFVRALLEFKPAKQHSPARRQVVIKARPSQITVINMVLSVGRGYLLLLFLLLLLLIQTCDYEVFDSSWESAVRFPLDKRTVSEGFYGKEHV